MLRFPVREYAAIEAAVAAAIAAAVARLRVRGLPTVRARQAGPFGMRTAVWIVGCGLSASVRDGVVSVGDPLWALPRRRSTLSNTRPGV